MRIQPREKSTNAAGSRDHTGIGRSVVEPNGIPVCVDDLAAWKYDIVHVSIAFGTEPVHRSVVNVAIPQ